MINKCKIKDSRVVLSCKNTNKRQTPQLNNNLVSNGDHFSQESTRT